MTIGKALAVFVVVPAVSVGGLIATQIGALGSTSSGSIGNTAVSSNVPSSYAKQLIPADILAIEQSSFVQQQCPGLSWTIPAAITHLESDDNRNPAAANPNSAGAIGANQFLPTTWDNQGSTIVKVAPFGKIPDGEGYGVDGDGDGLADIRNPADSIPAAARLLCANGGGNPKTLPQAIYAYNHVWWYVYGGTSDSGTPFEGVLPLAAKLAAPVNLSDSTATSANRSTVISAAYSQLGVPYAWAGGNAQGPTTGVCVSGAASNDCNVVGFDCSGLVIYAFAKVGITFPHLAASQYYETLANTVTTSVDDLSQAKAGDLVFFRGSDGTDNMPGHVGIYIGNNYMINAPESGETVSLVDITSPSRRSDFVAITDPFAAKANVHSG